MNAHHPAHIVQGQDIGQMKRGFQPQGHGLLRQHPVTDGITHGHALAINKLLKQTGFGNGNRHRRVKLLPHAWHGGERGGRDLTHVFGHGVGVLNKVEHGAGVNGEILAAQALGHMAQRQKQHAFISLVLAQHLVVAPHDVDKRGMAVHRAFGFAGGARGVNQDGQVFRAAAVHTLLEQTGVGCVEGGPLLAQLVQADHHRVTETGQAFHVHHHNQFQLGQLFTRDQGFVELFFIFNKQHGGG